MVYLTFMRMLKNKFLMLALVFGIIIAILSAGIIPMYSKGLSQRMLESQLDESSSTYSFTLPFSTLTRENYKENCDLIISSVKTQLNLPAKIIFYEHALISKELFCVREDIKENREESFQAVAYNEFNVDLLYGRLPQTRNDNIIEALIDKNTEISMDMTVGTKYFCHLEGHTEGVYIMPVGVVASGRANSFILNYSDLYSLLENNFIKDIDFNILFDYKDYKISNISEISEINRNFNKWLDFNNAVKLVPDENVFNEFLNKQSTVELLILLFEIPMLLIVVFYLFFISNNVIKGDLKEIALLRSRGATKKQIFLSYLLQSAVLTLVAFLIAIPLSYLFSFILGMTSDFLEFNNRSYFAVEFSFVSILYVLVLCCVSIVSLLIPLIKVINFNTVKLKKGSSQKPLWQKIYLDVILLLVSFLGYYSYKTRQVSAMLLGTNEMPIEPIVFFMVFFFALGWALLYVRIYPFVLNGIFKCFKSKLNINVYAGIKQVVSNSNISVFLIITIILCLFSANASRSISKHTLDRFNYSTGADCVIELEWNTVEGNSENEPEKPYVFENFKGVKNDTRVITGCSPSMEEKEISFMGIDTKEFSQICYVRGDENETHLNNYLNLLGSEPMACLISQKTAEVFSLKKGDAVIVKPTISNNTKITFIVYEIVELFPSYNPYTDAPLIVANSEYVDYMLPNLDFDVWMSLAENANKSDILNQINDIYKIENITVRNDIIEGVLSDAFLQATNGILTFDFICVLSVLFVGFLIYQLLDLKKRIFQFASLRALGAQDKDILTMILTENIFGGFFSIMFAVIIAYITSLMFVPISSVAFDVKNLVPNMNITFNNNDYFKIYIFIASIYFVISAFVIFTLKKIQPANAIKLSED